MTYIKRFLPKSLLGRSLLIIVTPMVLLQAVSALIFFENHWSKVSLRLARGLAGDIATIDNLISQNPKPGNQQWIFSLARRHMNITASIKAGEVLPNTPPVAKSQMERILIKAIAEGVNRPFQIDTVSLDRRVIINLQLPEGVLEIITIRKRLFSTTTYVFILWMVGTSLILLAVAIVFMRNQVKPIRRLAKAADDLGKGRDVPSFKPEGATEVRRAAAAFLAMRERIMRHVSQRTEMLAGVSHDLRTPLTRMKLQLEMAGTSDSVANLKEDVSEMEHMLEGYLNFARGEGKELSNPENLTSLLNDVVARARRKGGLIDLHTEGDIMAMLKPVAFRRCLTNLIDNATRYGKHVSLRAGQRGDFIEITIDDDGPGIPEEMHDEVFKPFFRLEPSRNRVTGGVGLGLTIARDVIRGHGGNIELATSPGGGLRVRLRLPL